VLQQSRHVVYPHYAATARTLGVDPLRDQATAGAYMWVLGTVAMAAAALLAAWLAIAREESRARRREAREDGRGSEPATGASA
jgi:cytochrome c oxidase assembly factor CtaG